MSNMVLYEILVPASHKKTRFTFEHHKQWDEFVKNISGGLTVMKSAKGQWISPDGTLFKDRVIPVRIACSKEQILEILKFTKEHYNQLAVMAYKVSQEVLIYD